MLDPLEGLPVFQIWRECRQIVGDSYLAKKKLTSEFFLFQVRRLETLVPKNHFVREVAPFPRSGHIFFTIFWGKIQVHKNVTPYIAFQ